MAVVLVYVDLLDGAPHGTAHPASLAALATGRRLADSWGATLYAAVVVHTRSPDDTLPGLDTLETQLGKGGADKVVVSQTDVPVAPLWSVLGTPWSDVLDHLHARLVLFGADAPATPELAARTGARIGARLLHRARAVGLDDVELRDRDGGYVRIDDSGATVAIVAAERGLESCEADIDLLVLDRGPDRSFTERDRVELVGTQPTELQHAKPVVIALGDDALEPEVVARTRKLAELLGATLVGGTAAAKAGAIPHAAVLARGAPVASELCIAVGQLALDIAGATTLVHLTTAVAGANKLADAVLTGPLAASLDALLGAPLGASR